MVKIENITLTQKSKTIRIRFSNIFYIFKNILPVPRLQKVFGLCQSEEADPRKIQYIPLQPQEFQELFQVTTLMLHIPALTVDGQPCLLCLEQFYNMRLII